MFCQELIESKDMAINFVQIGTRTTADWCYVQHDKQLFVQFADIATIGGF